MSFGKMICAAVFGTALLSGSASAASIAPDQTALARLDRAHAEGRFDDAQYALLAIRLLRQPMSMPEDLRPAADEPHPKCGTLIARRAFRMSKAGLFNAEQQAEYAMLGGRPNLPNSLPVMYNAAQVGIVHYPASVSMADAAEIVGYLEFSWTTQFGTMAWRPPTLDVGGGGADPSPLFDMYLDPGLGYAYTQPIQENTCTDPWACTASFIVLDNSVPNVETYVAHELSHASQFAYDYSDGDFIYEATATWMEDKVYDAVNDYEFFIADFQTRPDDTLSCADCSDYYIYGGAVFTHWLADVFDGGGTDLVRDVWDGLKNNADWYDGVEAALSGSANIEDIYREFAGARILTGIRDDGTIEEGDNMTSLTIEAGYDFGNLDGGETSSPPMGMGANYITVTASGAEAGDEVTLHISSDEPGPWAITTIAMPAAGQPTFAVFVDDDGDGSLEATVADIASYNEIGFAITNTANAGDGVDSIFDSGVDKSTHPFSWNFGGGSEKDPVGCGCTIPAGRRSPNLVSTLAALFVVAFSIVIRRRALP